MNNKQAFEIVIALARRATEKFAMDTESYAQANQALINVEEIKNQWDEIIAILQHVAEEEKEEKKNSDSEWTNDYNRGMNPY